MSAAALPGPAGLKLPALAVTGRGLGQHAPAPSSTDAACGPASMHAHQLSNAGGQQRPAAVGATLVPFASATPRFADEHPPTAALSEDSSQVDDAAQGATPTSTQVGFDRHALAPCMGADLLANSQAPRGWLEGH
jgi:hypothetical protein